MHTDDYLGQRRDGRIVSIVIGGNPFPRRSIIKIKIKIFSHRVTLKFVQCIFL